MFKGLYVNLVNICISCLAQEHSKSQQACQLLFVISSLMCYQQNACQRGCVLYMRQIQKSKRSSTMVCLIQIQYDIIFNICVLTSIYPFTAIRTYFIRFRLLPPYAGFPEMDGVRLRLGSDLNNLFRLAKLQISTHNQPHTSAGPLVTSNPSPFSGSVW